MKVEDIKLLYAYNEWANQRILDRAAQVTPEQFVQPNEMGLASIRGALVHILDAEYGWFNFLFERERGWIKEEEFADLAALRARWEQEDERTQACLATLQDEDLTRVHPTEWEGQEYRWVLWQALVHVVNHGTQHRSECAAVLTGLGHSPGDMDFTVFLNSR